MTSMLLGGVCGALAGACGYASYRSSRTLKRLDQEQLAMQHNVATKDTLDGVAIGQRVVFQHKVDEKAGVFLVDLSRQHIKEKDKVVPVQSTSVGVEVAQTLLDLYEPARPRARVTAETKVGVQTHTERSIGLKPWRSVLTKRDFGSSRLVPTESVDPKFLNRNALGAPVAEKPLMDGASLQHLLSECYGVQMSLKNDTGYGMRSFALGGQTVYCAGTKMGDKVVFDQVAMDPITLVKKDFQDRRNDADFGFWAGAAGAVGFALVGVGLLAAKD